MESLELNPADISVGVVGIGLMGSSIVVALLSSGHQVKAIAPISADLEGASDRITEQLKVCRKAGLMNEEVFVCLERLEISEDYKDLRACSLVLECVIEDSKIKALVYQKITDVVSADTVIASNTSAITITALQRLVVQPERFIGIHWAEPAYATRFMEITCGEDTDRKHADWVFNLAHYWRKEPTLLKKDTRGFITNRLMYAVYREIFCLIEEGKTTMDDADKVFRYDVGSWITLMGIFRRIDYIGLKDHEEIFKNLFPRLSNADDVPVAMQHIVNINARGIQNLSGLYNYTSVEAKEWEQAFLAFNEEIFKLAASYPDPIPDIDKALA